MGDLKAIRAVATANGANKFNCNSMSYSYWFG